MDKVFDFSTWKKSFYASSVTQEQIEAHFKDIVKVLRKFGAIFFIEKGHQEKIIAGKELEEISQDFHKKHGILIVRVSQIHSGLKQQGEEVYLDRSIQDLLVICLVYIVNKLRDPEPQVEDVLDHFLSLRKCIVAFCTTPIILTNQDFKEIISYWIVDLVKIITEADGIARNTPKYLKVYNILYQILTTLAISPTFRNVVLREILMKWENALEFYTINPELKSYFAEKSVVFQYLLLIMKKVTFDCTNRGHVLEEIHVAKIRSALEVLKKCLEHVSPSIMLEHIEDILRVAIPNRY